jgi:preprotein translocase subunit SecE
MALNREQKRQLRRRGELGADGEPTRQRRAPAAAPVAKQKEKRTSPMQFLREVRGELRKVAWPTREETINYSLIVLVTVVILTAFIAAIDWLFAEAVFRLFET